MKTALLTYSDLCKKQEEERVQAEKERRRIIAVERKRLQGDELYRKAIAGDRIDEGLVWQAADLGCRPACLYLGRQMMEAWSAGPYTKEEKVDIAEVAKEFFRTASFEEDFEESKTEAKFGYLIVSGYYRERRRCQMARRAFPAAGYSTFQNTSRDV